MIDFHQQLRQKNRRKNTHCIYCQTIYLNKDPIMTPQPILFVKKPTKTGESLFISFMMNGNSSVIGAKSVAIIRLYKNTDYKQAVDNCK